MMKFPTIQSITGGLLATVKRFPLTVLCALVGTAILIHITRHDWFGYSYYHYNYEHMIVWAKIAMCCALGLCLFMAASLFSESKGHGLKEKIIVQAIMFVLIVAYYFSIQHYESFGVENLTRYSLYIIASHMMVAFAPFLKKNSINGFWQFNRILFLRFLLSFLYTVVLYGGICIAMWLLDDLLHVEIHGHYYAYAWFCMAGIFNTLFFLSGVPQNITELDADTTYLKGLKGFTQFVLLPLVTGYLLILYAYALRMIIIGDLPKGYVSNLVISFSGLGILSLLLIYPIRNLDDNKWIKTFSKWFYWALYPLIVLLGFSIYHRIHEYGITADRYFVIVLAIWLACMSAYFLFNKKENIKLIPISLCVIAIMSSFGPWGAFGISARSQKNQLEKVLVENKILVNGKIDTNGVQNADYQTKYRIQSIVAYLIKIDNLEVIQPWFKQSLDTLQDDGGYNGRYYYYNKGSDVVMSYIGFKEYSNSGYNNYNSIITRNFMLQSSSSDEPQSIELKGYDYVSKMRDYYGSGGDDASVITSGCFAAGSHKFYISPHRRTGEFEISANGLSVIDSINIQEFLQSLDTAKGDKNNGYMYITPEKFVLKTETKDYVFEFHFINISSDYKYKKYKIRSIQAEVLTKIK